MGNAIDFSYAHTDQKEADNLLALTGNGNVKGTYYGSATWDPGNILDGDEVATDITVNGVALGDMVIGVSFSLDVTDLTLSADVTAADTVTAVLANSTGAGVDLASGTVRVLVADVT